MGTLTRLLSGSLSSTVYRLVKGGEIMPKAWVSINPSNEDAPITLSTSAGSEQFTADEAGMLRELPRRSGRLPTPRRNTNRRCVDVELVRSAVKAQRILYRQRKIL